ncbi:MAG: dihydropteroate synthase [Thermoleophilia bacterium]|nr:dihydropteroate synthase [Thermoleophilia bacterium]
MKQARVSAPGINIMEKKSVFRAVRVRDLELRAANILKQEMLARGGEAAISREVFEWRGEKADCIITGTLAQFERLIEKLKLQPFGLRALASSIQAALDNYDKAVPESSLSLELAQLPLLMGVLNVTPDSFSDGGDFREVNAALSHARRMVEEGAALIDVGGESSRPGADPVDAEEELRRVLPVIRALAPELPGRISVDTYKAEVAAKALAEGAYMVNDISAFRMDPEMVAVVRDADCPVVLMHMLGTPKTMQNNPQYRNVVSEIYDFFVERLNWAVDHGVREANLLIDPGIGFGKTTAHNLEILRNLAAFRSLGRPLVIGASRKRFLGEILGISEPKGRDTATAFTTVLATLAGAHVIRVHDIPVNRDAARLARAVKNAGRD